MHVDTLRRPVLYVLGLVLRNLGEDGHVVERPASVGASHLLAHGREEALAIREAREPEGLGTAALDPLVELLVPPQQRLVPDAHRRREPRALEPQRRHLGVGQRVQGLREVVGHDDGAVDGQLQVLKGAAHDIEDALQHVHLLAEGDVDGLGDAALVEVRLDLLLLEGPRQLRQEVLGHLRHHLLARRPLSAAAALRLRVDDGREDLLGVVEAEHQVGVHVEPKHLGHVRCRVGVDVLAEVVDLGALRHGVALDEGVARLEDRLAEELFREGVHLPPVPVVGDAAAVLDLRDHVAHRRPRDVLGLLGVHVEDVVLEEERAGVEVRLVELVGHGPPDGSELAALLGDAVQVAQHPQERAPLDAGHSVEHVLRHPRVGALHAGAHAHGGLVGDLDSHLEQPDGDARVRLGRDPHAELYVDVLELDHVLLELHEIPQA
mmetsp:Transcript_60189/g.148006  ORF Transcript_60189/g.148006 Transcript_60189/m.148006 type:complete len:435 (-) Transcript_60189:5812-7116(-)